MCFLSGSIIFEDNNSKLFNFLTYGLLDENEIGCDKKVERTNAHISFTHNEVYKTDIRRGVVFMCSRACEYQQFDLLPQDFNKYQDMWLGKVEEYYLANR